MSIFVGLEEIVETDYPLGQATWYGLGGPADYFIRPGTVEQLKKCAAEDKTFLRVPAAGHNDLMQVGFKAYFEAIAAFCGTSTPPRV